MVGRHRGDVGGHQRAAGSRGPAAAVAASEQRKEELEDDGEKEQKLHH